MTNGGQACIKTQNIFRAAAKNEHKMNAFYFINGHIPSIHIGMMDAINPLAEPILKKLFLHRHDLSGFDSNQAQLCNLHGQLVRAGCLFYLFRMINS